MCSRSHGTNCVFEAYRSFEGQNQNSRENVHGLLREIKRPCIVWGLSRTIRKIISTNKDFKDNIDAIIDRKPMGVSYYGIPIFRPSQSIVSPLTVIIGSSIRYEEIYELVVKKFGKKIKSYYVNEIEGETKENISPFLLVTIPRSGTHWLRNMIEGFGFISRSRLFPERTAEQITSDFIERFPGLCDGYFYYEHLGYKDVETLIDKFEPKVVILYRDPRDTLVSSYFYNTKRKGTYFSDDGFYDFFLKYIQSHRQSYESIAIEWLRYGNLFSIKYEKMVADTEREMTKLMEFLNVRTDIDLSTIISKYSFNKLSGGREKGEEDVTHHYRKGIIGDWQNWFDDRMEQIYMHEFGDIHYGLGYAF